MYHTDQPNIVITNSFSDICFHKSSIVISVTPYKVTFDLHNKKMVQSIMTI